MTSARSFGAAQTVPRRGDVAANVAEHLRLIDTAAREQVRTLVFPELSLTGYELELAAALAFVDEDPRLTPLRARATSHRMTLIVGAPVRLDARLHIGAFIVRPDDTLGLYTKHHLGSFSPEANPGGLVPPGEPTIFHPGDRDPLVDLGDSVAAIAVCADTGHTEHPRRAADRGATAYLASMFFTPAEVDKESARLAGYATHHRMTVVAANYGGPTGDLASGGGSAIWSPTGAPLVQLGPRGAGLAVAVADETGWRARAVMLET